MSTQTGSISFESTGNFSQVVKQNYATLSQIKGQFAVCSTGASTTEKIATTVPTNADWTLYAGATVTVKFTSANTASVPTLNVNGSGPKEIRDYNANELLKAAREWPAGAAIAFTYDGTYWRIQDSKLMERVHSAETRVDQTATSITSLASMEDNYTKPDGTTAKNNMKSYVDQTAEGITTTITNISEKIETIANPNLGPFFMWPLTDIYNATTNPNGFWRSMLSHTITKLDDGWAHITLNNASGTSAKYATAHVAKDAVPVTSGTLLVEIANISTDITESTGNALWVDFSKVVDGTQVPQVGSSAAKYFFDNGAYYIAATPTNNENPERWSRSWFGISAGHTAEFDARISFYEGTYDGPYKPYVPISEYIETKSTVNSVKQTADSNSAHISNLTTVLGTNADGTTKSTDIVHKYNELDQTLEGTVSAVGKIQSEIETVANANLSPWFSESISNIYNGTDNPNGYWRRIATNTSFSVYDMQQKHNGSGGWAHFVGNVTSGNPFIRFEPMPISLKPSTEYTFMLEIDGTFASTLTNVVWKLAESTETDAFDLFNVKAELVSPESVTSGVYYIKTTTRADIANATTLSRAYLQLYGTGTFDVYARISLYEGDYSGPYKPYVDPTLSSRLTNAETMIAQNADSIALSATKEELNNINNNIKSIKSTCGRTLNIEDAASLPLLSLDSIYGECTQSGTPTPDIHIPIKSVSPVGGEKNLLPSILNVSQWTKQSEPNGSNMVISNYNTGIHYTWTGVSGYEIVRVTSAFSVVAGQKYRLRCKYNINKICNRRNAARPFGLSVRKEISGSEDQTSADFIGVAEFQTAVGTNLTTELIFTAPTNKIYLMLNGGMSVDSVDHSIDVWDIELTTGSLEIVSSTGDISYLDMTDSSTGKPVELYSLNDTYRDVLIIDSSGHALVEKRTYKLYANQLVASDYGTNPKDETLGLELNATGTDPDGIDRFNKVQLGGKTTGYPLPICTFLNGASNASSWTGGSAVLNTIAGTTNSYPHNMYCCVSSSKYANYTAFNTALQNELANEYVIVGLYKDYWYTIDLGYVNLPEVADDTTVHVVAEIQPQICGSWWTKIGEKTGIVHQSSVKENAELHITADGISSEVSKVTSIKYYNSATPSWTLSGIKTYAAEGHSDSWNISSATPLTDLRVGDTVYVKGTDSTRNCPVYIKITVTSIDSLSRFTGISHGYEDILPVDTIKSTINQSSDSVKIQAKHIEIDGTATFKNSDNTTTTLGNYLNTNYDEKGAAAAVQNNLNNINVGGRNLLKGRTTSSWTTNGITFEYDASTHISHIYGTNTKTNAVWTQSNFYMPSLLTDELVPGEEYTLTCYDLGGFFDSDLYVQLNTYVTTGTQVGDWTVGKGRNIPSHTNTVRVNHDHHDGWANLFMGVPTTVRNVDAKVRFKFEKGNVSTDYSPAPEDLALASTGVYYATCSTAAGTAVKVATTEQSGFTLVPGAMVNVKFTATNSAAVADLKLNVDETGDKLIKYIYNNSLCNLPGVGYLLANNVYTFRYDGTNWVVQLMYNTDTQSRTRWQNVIKAAAAITNGHVICGTASGYRDIAASVTFDLSYPLLYCATTKAAGETSDNNFLQINGVKVTNNGTVTSAANYKTVYLIGTVSGNTFTVKASPFMTTVVPTSEDGFFYIPLGMFYNSTTNIYFNSTKDLYAYIDGKFRQVTPTEIVATQRIYWRTATSGTPSKPSSWVTATSNSYASWTTKVPPLSSDGTTGASKYPYLYTCEQRKRLDGTVECTAVLLDDSTTVIDGGNIITGTVTANAIKADSGTFNTANIPNLDAAKITSGSISADRIKANVVSAINATANKIDAKNINVSTINIGDLTGEVGGRNLLLQSQLFGTAGKTNRIVGKYNNNELLVSRADGFNEIQANADFRGISVYADSMGFAVGEKLILSTNVRSDSTVGTNLTFYCMAFNASGTRIQTALLHLKTRATQGDGASAKIYANDSFPAGAEERIIVEITWLQAAQDLLDAGGNIRFTIQAASSDWSKGNVAMWAPKLERGNVATDWTPAPEDVDSAIDDASKIASNYISADSSGIRIASANPATQKQRIWLTSGRIDFYNASDVSIGAISGDVARFGKLDHTYVNINGNDGDIDIYKNGYLKAKYSSTITLYGGNNTSGTNPKITLGESITDGGTTRQSLCFYDNSGNQRLKINSGVGLIIGLASKGHIQITDTGMTVYDTNNKARSVINASGLDVRDTDGSTSVALFAASSRIGKAALGHVIVDSTGMTVYDTNNKKRTAVNASGLTVYDASEVDVGNFAATARIGKSNSSRFLMNADSLQAYNSSNTKYFEINASGVLFGGTSGLNGALQVKDTNNNLIADMSKNGIFLSGDITIKSEVGSGIFKRSLETKIGEITIASKELMHDLTGWHPSLWGSSKPSILGLSILGFDSSNTALDKIWILPHSVDTKNYNTQTSGGYNYAYSTIACSGNLQLTGNFSQNDERLFQKILLRDDYIEISIRDPNQPVEETHQAKIKLTPTEIGLYIDNYEYDSTANAKSYIIYKHDGNNGNSAKLYSYNVEISASEIDSGTFSADRIPGLAASKITSGTLPIAHGGTGATTAADALAKLAGSQVYTTNSTKNFRIETPLDSNNKWVAYSFERNGLWMRVYTGAGTNNPDGAWKKIGAW